MSNKVVDVTLRFIDKFTAPMQGAIGKLETHARQYKRMGREIEGTGKAIASTGQTLTKAVTLPIAGLGIAAVKTAADFEAGMSKVQSISGASAKEMESLSAKAMEMGAKTKFSASESAAAFSYMSMAGWKTQDMLDGIEGVMYLAGASGEDLALTSDIVTDALTAFGMKASDTNMFVDVLAKTASNANTDVAMMGETFQYIAPVAGALGYNVKDVSVAIGLMANSGIKASAAGTSLRSFLSNLSKPSKEVSNAMNELGISLTDSKGEMKDFSVLMGEMRAAFSGLSEAQKAQYASTLAGKTGMSGLLAIVNATEGDFNKLTESVENSNGAAKEMYDIANNNLQGQLTIIKSTLESIAITFGNKLIPFVKAGAEHLQQLADRFAALSDEQVEFIIKIAGIAAAVGPALLVFGKLVFAVGKVVSIAGQLGSAISSAGGVMALITGPAGIVVLAIGAIVAATILVIKNWDAVKAAAGNVWNFIKDVFSDLGFSAAGFGDKFAGLKEKFGVIVSSAQELWTVVSPYLMKFGELWTTVFQIQCAAAIGAAVGLISSLGSSLMDWASGAMTALGGVIEFITGVFTGNWSKAWNGVKDIFKGVFQSFIALAKMPINAVISIINGAIAGINRLSISIPDWVPVLGGKKFSINIPKIPLLYQGTDNWKGGPAIIHDRGAEIVDLPGGTRVIPHDKSLKMAESLGRIKALADLKTLNESQVRREFEGNSNPSDTAAYSGIKALAELIRGMKEDIGNQKTEKGNLSINLAKVADSIVVREQGDIDAIAEALASKLEDTALNMGIV